MRWIVAGLSGALVLAACSSGESGSNASDKGGGAMTGGGQDQPTPSNLRDDPQNGMEPVTLPSPKPITAIPAAFQGRWGMVVTDCEPAQPGLKGFMRVTGSDIVVQGAHLVQHSLAMNGTGGMTAELLYPAGGQPARRPNRLTLLDDGKTLVRQEQNAPSVFRYSRCPA